MPRQFSRRSREVTRPRTESHHAAVILVERPLNVAALELRRQALVARTKGSPLLKQLSARLRDRLRVPVQPSDRNAGDLLDSIEHELIRLELWLDCEAYRKQMLTATGVGFHVTVPGGVELDREISRKLGYATLARLAETFAFNLQVVGIR